MFSATVNSGTRVNCWCTVAMPSRHRALRVVDVDQLAVEHNCAMVGLVDTAKNLDQGRLAGAVLADDGVDLPRPNSDGDLLKGMRAAERLGDIAQFEEILLAPACLHPHPRSPLLKSRRRGSGEKRQSDQ